MNPTRIKTSAAPQAIGPYAQAVTWQGLVFCSGQIALDPETGELVGSGDVRSETRRAMTNLGAVLAEAGSGFDRVLKTTIYVADMNDFGAVNEEYGRFFEGGALPARATVEVAGLPKGARVEIEAIAAG